ncbi:UDP-N-acetylmuramate dehydrogenase [Pseudohongiella spirulinae]|uniref:UDP-N-acetylenolpyruvoylglucosamine reductase n=1 Tax=Pseudohongiella spirulinae TaxID=1249552 RepID=A0A0S2KDS1_9GAMM|nr:UDP-N-acetylmuramate dehydrogenase [Pseudohongiella spirulinae]ALO46460.1 UDP-N-acetylenolpyruvoylglucosamine reductase [Pseudohongiella spirulinae]
MNFPSNWQADASLQSLHTFGFKVHARWLVQVEQEDELPAILAVAERKDLPVMILGGGSNVLFVSDYPGLVVHLQLQGVRSRAEGERILVTAAAGESWHDFVEYCLGRGWYGLENLALIPGSVGAAPVQNIGAYGVELAAILHSVRYLDRQDMCVKTLAAVDCQFAYRDSIFKHELRDRAIILSCTFSLSAVPQSQLEYPALRQTLAQLPGVDLEQVSPRQVFDAVCALRRSKLPDPAVLGNAGSFFRNPIISRAHCQQLLSEWSDMPVFEIPHDPGHVKVPAAWLIEQAGWKGVRRGFVGVHDQQALVLVHDYLHSQGAASASELVRLAGDIAESVQQRFGIQLQPEVQIVGL